MSPNPVLWTSRCGLLRRCGQFRFRSLLSLRWEPFTPSAGSADPIARALDVRISFSTSPTRESVSSPRNYLEFQLSFRRASSDAYAARPPPLLYNVTLAAQHRRTITFGVLITARRLSPKTLASILVWTVSYHRHLVLSWARSLRPCPNQAQTLSKLLRLAELAPAAEAAIDLEIIEPPKIALSGT